MMKNTASFFQVIPKELKENDRVRVEFPKVKSTKEL
jgi:hypothetical protein